MIVGHSEFEPGDYARFAELHVANLEKSVVSQLGLSILRRYYRYIAGSPQDFLFAEGEPGAVRGIAVLSLNSNSVMQRFVRTIVPAFLWAVLLKTLQQPSFALVLLKSAGGASSFLGEAARKPEIVQIFVEQKYRNQQLGKRLLEQVDGFLAERGVESYFIRTRLHNNEATLGFYNRNRFTEFERTAWKDDEFVFMTRATAPE